MGKAGSAEFLAHSEVQSHRRHHWTRGMVVLCAEGLVSRRDRLCSYPWSSRYRDCQCPWNHQGSQCEYPQNSRYESLVCVSGRPHVRELMSSRLWSLAGYYLVAPALRREDLNLRPPGPEPDQVRLLKLVGIRRFYLILVKLLLIRCRHSLNSVEVGCFHVYKFVDSCLTLEVHDTDLPV